MKDCYDQRLVTIRLNRVMGQIAAIKRSRPDLAADVNFKGTPVKVMACGGGPEAPAEALEALESR